MEYAFWGKTIENGQYHHLCNHSFDVAAVVRVLLDEDALLRKRILCLSPLDDESTVNLLCFFAAIHDIGKFSLNFQNKVPELASSFGLPPWNLHDDPHHTATGYWLWKQNKRQWARLLADAPHRTLAPLVGAALYHHGVPAGSSSESRKRNFRKTGECAAELVNTAARMFPVQCDWAGQTDTSLQPMSWLAAGLFVLADWIGSDERFFLPEPDWQGAEAYYPLALDRAKEAVQRSGVLSARPSPHTEFGQLLPHLQGAEPHPMQRYVQELAPPRGPELLILEDLTGGGKTESAILAAHRCMRTGSCSGLFVALPTMATANGIYSRLSESYRSLFASKDASLVLAHGAAAIHDDYQASIGLQAIPAQPGRDNESAAMCSTWLADNRKRALLAPCGAGTLDQTLLGILPSRHQCLRLLGLCRSVLVADEIHSYDGYTGKLLERLLTFQAALGGSAVLLSATLTLDQRSRFIDAWQLGRSLSGAATCDTGDRDSVSFPLATRCTDQGVRQTPVESSRSWSVEVVPVHEEPAMRKTLVEARSAGACACWIRNTVADALEARRLLVEEDGIAPEDVLLFHARFAGSDRRRIEAQVQQMFGKESKREQRAGKVLVATQVAEQSLDLDFDLMLSDLAPMDLIIQRAGRCHRRKREWRDQLGAHAQPRLLVLMPEPETDVSADWYARMFPVARWVYPRPALLWRTARLLQQRRALDLPCDARDLLESAYGVDAPEALQEEEYETYGKYLSDCSMANFASLQFESGYMLADKGGSWKEDIKAPTRLGEDTHHLRLICLEPDGPRLWAASSASDVSTKTCRLSELRVAVNKISTVCMDKATEELLEPFLQSMPDACRWSHPLPLHPEGEGIWTGSALDAKGCECRVFYDSLNGLRLEEDS